jgi:polyhydroxybutyrate depolymerase
MNKIAIAFIALSIVACSGASRGIAQSTTAPNPASGGTVKQTITSGGTTRIYLLHVPPSYQSGTPMPLVLNFHGLEESPAEQELLSGMSAKADGAGFIVVYPEGINKLWADIPGAAGNADKQFIRDLVQSLEKEYSIDPKRVFATGISNGGGMTNRVGCDLADVFATIGPVSGAYNLWRDCGPSRPVPVVAFHGLADKIVPYDGVKLSAIAPPIRDWAAAWAERDQCGSTPVTKQVSSGVTSDTWQNCQGNAVVVLYTIQNHGHSWPGSHFLPEITSQEINATDVMWEFFKAHPMP